MTSEYQVVFAGEGGQGLVVTGTLLGEAAVVYENRYATQTVDYGIASRGGFAMAEVKISDDEIDCPELTNHNYVVALTDEAFRRMSQHVQSGLIIYDSDQVALESVSAVDVAVVGYPMTTTLRELGQTHGKAARINVLAMGVLLGIEQIVTPTSLARAFGAQFGRRAVEANMAVLQTGIELAQS